LKRESKRTERRDWGSSDKHGMVARVVVEKKEKVDQTHQELCTSCLRKRAT
jgi:hypothetical protein